MNIRWPVFRLIVCLLLSAFPVLLSANAEMPRNIIFFIGDGMGLSQISAARIINGHLNLDQLPLTGIQTTYSNNELVTDSAAAGTALSTGYKTDNGVIALSPDGRPLKTLFEYAKEKNMSTGLVVTCSVTHATPAVFVAHTDSRKNQLTIARQIAEGDTDVILGGGLGYFLPHSNPNSYRYDELDLISFFNKQELNQKGAGQKKSGQKTTVVFNLQQFNNVGEVKRLVGLFARKHLPKVSQNRQPSLADMTRKALQILSGNPQGFVLMVEGSQIDWGGHQNDQAYMLSELVDFDKAIAVALEFSKTHPDTLILVTADHETGGYAIHNGSIKEQKVTDSAFTTRHHTATMVPVFATGTGSEAFSGIMDNTDIGKTLIEFVNRASAIPEK